MKAMTSEQAAAVAAMMAAFGSKAEAMAALASAYGSSLPTDDAAFAAMAKDAARGVEGAGRFDRKVFVAYVLQALGVEAGDVAAVKTRLVRCHQAGLLNLSRCDLVEAFPAKDVDESEINHGRAQWHFVRL